MKLIPALRYIWARRNEPTKMSSPSDMKLPGYPPGCKVIGYELRNSDGDTIRSHFPEPATPMLFVPPFVPPNVTSRAWDGRLYNPWDLKPADICIRNIARALSNLCRYGGACPFYSVAQHSVLVSYVVADTPGATARDVAWAQLHDAAEAFSFGDLTRPIKHSGLCEQYRAGEKRAMRVIADHFNLGWPCPRVVTLADTLVGLAEKHWLTRTDRKINLEALPEFLRSPILGLEPERAEALFLDRFREVMER